MIDFTPEQLNVIESVLENKDKSEQRIGGIAGTGKTCIASHIYDELTNHYGLDVAVCCPTGKAAHVLTQKGTPATTIHNLIYKYVEKDTSEHVRIKLLIDKCKKEEDFEQVDKLEKQLKRLPKRLIFTLKDKLEVDHIISDESSMINGEVYEDLCSFGVPIIFIGDHGQLPPIGKQINLMQNLDHKLETVHRNAGEIAKFCSWLRKGNEPKQYTNTLPEIDFIRNNECRATNDTQIITYTNNKRISINKGIRLKLGYKNVLEAGEKIIFLKNNRTDSIWNGQMAVVKSVFQSEEEEGLEAPKALEILAEIDGKDRIITISTECFNQKNPDTFSIKANPCDYAYAITCHKAQGSEFDKVMIIDESWLCLKIDKINGRDLQTRWRYTAASRAKKHITWLV